MRSGVRKILHLRTVSGKGGGPEKTLLFTPRFLGDNYDVRLAYIRPAHDPEYDMPQRAKQMGVSLIDIPENGPADPRTLARLAREVRQFQPDLLHAHDYKTNILSVWLGRWFRLPVLTTLHGYVTLGGRLGLYYRLDRWALRRMTHLISVSPDLDEFLANLGIPSRRRSLIENAIDTDLYLRRDLPEKSKRKLGFAAERLLVGAVGRLQPEKGFDLLIEAANLLYQRGFDFDLAIVGEGPIRGDLEQLISRTGQQSRIRLLGHRSDMIDLYQAMDVFVLSSLREGLPNVLLEAMSLETPVVATRVAGTPRILEHGVNGLLVNPGDTSGLAEAVGRLVDDRRLREGFASAGRRTVEQRYSFARRMEKMRVVYDNVLAERAGAANASQRATGNVYAGR
jgi:glycosyltransferase involved in cell wall biosynthesis